MRADTKEALKASIAHHKRVRDDRHGDEQLGINNCALCQMYHRVTTGFSCERVIDEVSEMCPVKERTGRTHCQGSPYYPYESGEYGDPDLEECRLYKDISDERFTEMMDKEIDFLENLLPKEN